MLDKDRLADLLIELELMEKQIDIIRQQVKLLLSKETEKIE
jgi:hypothetical protein